MNYIRSTYDVEKLTFRLTDVFDGIKEIVSIKARLSEIEMTVHFENADLKVEGSKSKLQTALLIVITNSIESLNYVRRSSNHSNQKSRIDLRIKTYDKTVAIEIEDNGSGISEEFGNQIFDFGFTTKLDRPGTGLSLARQIIEQDFNGSIEVASFRDPTILVINIPLK